MKNLLLLAIAVNCSGAFAAVMRLQVCVVDADSGEPIAGAEVGAGFYNPPLFWGGESQDMHRDGVTDKHGRCSLVGRSSRGRCGVTVRVPDKYYNGFGQCQLNEADRNQWLVPHFHSMTVALSEFREVVACWSF